MSFHVAGGGTEGRLEATLGYAECLPRAGGQDLSFSRPKVVPEPLLPTRLS